MTFRHPKTNQKLLLRLEDSMHHQNNLGADIIIALDDVVSATNTDQKRFKEATYCTIQKFDRYLASHEKKKIQNVFLTIQSGLDLPLREICLEAFRDRDHLIPGYAISGLSGRKEKESFVKIVDFCCNALHDTKPRHLMGVGYPLYYIILCTA